MKLSLVMPLALSLIACGAKDVPRESTAQTTSAPLLVAPATVSAPARATDEGAPAPLAPGVAPEVPPAVTATTRVAAESPAPGPSMTAVAAPRPLVAAQPRTARSAELVRRAPLVSPGLVPAAPVSPTPAMYTSPQGQDNPPMTSVRGSGREVTPGDFSPRPLQVAPTGNQLTNLTTSPSFGGTPRSF